MNKKIVLAILGLLLLLPAVSAARPVIDVDLVSQDPQPATPGTLVDLVFKVTNEGEVQATGVSVELVEAFPISVADGEAIKNIGFLAFTDDDEPQLVRFKVDLDDNAPDGDVPVRVRITSDSSSSPIEKEFDLDVQSRDATLSVSSIETTPAKAPPGQESTIDITISNPGTTSLRDITVKLDFSGSTLPFTPTKTATTQQLNLLRAGESRVVSYTFITDAEAEAQAYKIPLSIDFVDNLNTEFSQTDTVGILVGGQPKMDVYLDDIQLATGSTNGQVVVQVVNKGFTDIKFLEVSSPDQGVTITSARQEYVGNLDSDDFESVTYDVFFAQGAPSSFDLPVVITYTDTNNIEYNEQFSITVNSQPAQKDNGGATIFVALLVIAVIIVSIVLYRRKKREE